jgi:membrane protein DedA with SNARE-associated domain
MTLESFIDTYGYLAILIGTFFEGETILILGGFAADRGYLALPEVILAAFCGTLFGDQLFFFLGHWHGRAFLARRPRWKARSERAKTLLERFQTSLILGFRFLYGLRTVTPFVIGMSGIRVPKFAILNILGAFVWAMVVGIGGYLFGSLMETLIGDMKRYEMKVLGIVVVIGSIVWVIHFYRRGRNSRLSRS